MADSLEAVYDDLAVDPSLARLRRHASFQYGLGVWTNPDAVVLVDRADHAAEQNYLGLSHFLSPFTVGVTYILKYRSRASATEWQALKALARRECAVLKPRCWAAVGPHAAEMLVPGGGAAGGVARTPHGTPVVLGGWPDVMERLRLQLLDSGEDFVPRG